MIAEVRLNEAFQILIRPSDAIDVAILNWMAIRAEQSPASLKLNYRDGLATLTVEKGEVKCRKTE